MRDVYRFARNSALVSKVGNKGPLPAHLIRLRAGVRWAWVGRAVAGLWVPESGRHWKGQGVAWLPAEGRGGGEGLRAEGERLTALLSVQADPGQAPGDCRHGRLPARPFRTLENKNRDS